MQVTEDLTPQMVIAVLEKAQEYRKSYPGIMLGYAIGLTALNDELGTYYATLLQSHDPFQDLPPEVDIDYYKMTAAHYHRVEAYLRSLKMFLDPGDPETALAQTIGKLRRKVL